MESPVDVARAEFLSSFRWTGGHADFARVLRNREFLRVIGPALATPFRHARVEAVIGLEARGFVLASLTARALGVGLVLARKPGSVHPDAESELAETADWRGNRTEVRISRSAVASGDRLLLVDDWIETGGQARAVRQLVLRMSAQLVGVSAVVDDTSDDIRTELAVAGLVASSALPADT